MKCKIPEISWHNRDPVLSVDIQPNKLNGDSLNNYRLASGGTDAHVLIWYMKMTSGKNGDIELDLAADLTRHQKAVNVVKWSPNGELLASGDDESVVFIWKLKSDTEPLNILDATNEQDKEVWITLKVLRGHMEDIYDLSWAPNSLFLVSGSVDNSAIMWDIAKGKPTSILKDHKGFVQGVAWDPKNQYIATLSTDRYLRIFDIQSKKVLHRISKGSLPVPEDSTMHGKTIRLFHDDTLQTFFRRLCFTPDGKLLLTPAGVADYDGCIHPINTTYAFSRYGFRQPAIVLPCPDQYTVAVSCCPLLFCLRPHDLEKNAPVVPLPYRMIFAVATKSSVYFYDTQQKQPFALISNIHYTRLTDLTWSQDGLVVVVSSTDGFCSLITFEKGELGEIFENSDAVLEAALAQVNSKNGKTKKLKENDNGARSRKPSLDGNNALKESTLMDTETVLEKINESNKEHLTAIETRKSEDDEKADKKANPIAIRRKPKEAAASLVSNETVLKKVDQSNKESLSDIEATKTGNDDKAQNEKKQNTLEAKPIAIRRKPRGGEESLVSAERVQNKIDEIEKKTVSPIKTKNSNDDKSQGGKNQDTPKANPIAMKKKPEGGSTSATSGDAKPIEIKTNSQASSTSPDKPATPIAIKRKPGSVGKQDTQPALVEAALAQKEDQQNTVEAKPIAIKRKPEGAVTSSASDEAKQIEIKPISRASSTSPEKPATPIAIKRKPDGVDKQVTQPFAANEKEDQQTQIEVKPISRAYSISPVKPATPIAIKRKSTSVGNPCVQPPAPTEKEDEYAPPKADKPDITSKVLTVDIILDKEILSSEEKFESPEKKSRPVTPISVRRHPRTPSQTPPQACQSPSSFAKIIASSADNLKNSSPKQLTTTPRQERKATPIAFRRIARTQISMPAVVSTPNMVEEAMDAWPLAKDGGDVNKDADKCNKIPLKETGVCPLPSEETADQTEDIRLVYEDTVEGEEATISTKCSTSAEKIIKSPTGTESKTETKPTTEEKAAENQPKQDTPNKSPKRVTLRTISTPKSKKKLLD